MVRFLIALAFVFLAGLGPAGADDPDMTAKIATMTPDELGKLIELVGTTVTHDALGLPKAGGGGDCLELTRLSNSFALGYGYLNQAAKRASEAKDARSQANLQTAIEARVVTFAARVKADEWLDRCTGFVIPADKQADPRYAKPTRVASSEFPVAVTDLRVLATARFRRAQTAGQSGACPAVGSAISAISLFVPYLDTMIGDLANRPDALGPFASRRDLMQDKATLVAAANNLYQRFAPTCDQPPAKNPAAPAPDPDPGAPGPG